MYVYIYLYRVLENSYSLKSREVGPILGCSKEYHKPSLVLLWALSSSQLFFFFFLIVKTGLWGNSQSRHAGIQGSLSCRIVTDKWMNVQVGDIIKLENNQVVTVSTSLGCGFFSFGLNRNPFSNFCDHSFWWPSPSSLCIQRSTSPVVRSLFLSISHHSYR